jgi:uncharacterized protein YigA (DUF484 family)
MLFNKMRSLILALLEARNVPELAAALERELKSRFSSEFVSLLLFDAKGIIGSAQNAAWADAQTHVQALIKGRQAVAGQLRSEERSFLFGHEGEQVKSCAVIPLQTAALQQDKPLGLLAIGSSNAEHFHASMDTLFIRFVGDVLARLLTLLLCAPAARQSA